MTDHHQPMRDSETKTNNDISEQNVRRALQHLSNALDPDYPDPWVEIGRAHGLLDKELAPEDLER